MGMIEVYKREKWIPQMNAKYVTVPEMAITVGYGDDAIKKLPDAQRKVYYAKFAEIFGIEGRAFREAKGKEVQRLIIKIETKMAVLPAAAAAALVKQANEVLKGELEKWAKELQAVCTACAKKAYDASCVVMKKAVTAVQFRSVVTIVLLVLIALAAAVAHVANAGSVDYKVLIAAAQGLFGAAKLLGPRYVSLNGTLEKLGKDVGDIKKAVEKVQTSKQPYANAIDKIKAWTTGVTSPVTSFDKDFAELDKFEGACLQDLATNMKALEAVKKEAAKAPGLEPKVAQAEAQVLKAKHGLENIAKLRASEAEMKRMLAKAEVPNFGALQTNVLAVKEALPVFIMLQESVKQIVELVGKLK